MGEGGRAGSKDEALSQPRCRANRVHQSGKVKTGKPLHWTEGSREGRRVGPQISEGIYSLSNINQGSRKQQKMSLEQEQGLRRHAVMCNDGNMAVVF